MIEGQIYHKFKSSMDKKSIKDILDKMGIERLSQEMAREIFKERKFKIPEIMGIMNITPDSFYEGSRFVSEESMKKFLQSNAQIFDIGAESTRPGSLEIPPEEEIERLEKVFPIMDAKRKYNISLDSRHYDTIEHFSDKVGILNDISGMSDIRIPELARKYDKKYVLMHIKGNPSNMSSLAIYSDLLGELSKFFITKLKTLSEIGLNHKNIIIDPGIGFAKVGEQNMEIIRNAEAFNFGIPRLFGYSRKSFLSMERKKPPKDKLPETISTSIFLAMKGVEILRLHDPDENFNALRTFQKFLNP